MFVCGGLGFGYKRGPWFHCDSHLFFFQLLMTMIGDHNLKGQMFLYRFLDLLIP
uniref:Uncharacterized protein n=1 Tax=Rhizophora mucronata TaxID=61149 RepID=A0A2P2QNQ1_RHIMU